VSTLARPRRLALVVLSAAALIAGLVAAIPSASAHNRAPASSHAAATKATPRIKHVWVIVLENTSFNNAFGTKGQARAPYLAKTLPNDGALLTHYYGTGHDSLDNYTAMISGQAGNYMLNQDCGLYEPFIQFGGENFDKWTKYRQLSGEGCVYPKYVKTIAGQLSHHGLSWRAYEQDMGNIPHRDGTVETKLGPACGHPKLRGTDFTDSTGPAKDSYATRHDPFMYFRSITDRHAYCDAHVLSLKPLRHDLKKVSTTPNYSFITPNTCMDAHDIPRCQNGSKGGLQRANSFLKKWIPRIMHSPAYKANGMILVTFDESGSDENAAACCGEVVSTGYDDPSHPNLNEPGMYGPGGGRVGAVVLSKFVKPGTVSNRPYNHYSQLRTFERLFGLARLGDALQPQVHAFGSDVFTRPHG
jgi:phosphatidylinositol-3-phosphatase